MVAGEHSIMASAKQIEANRLNSKRSTGPKSTEGKRRASQNAVKHGILQAAPVVRGIEKQEDWVAHRAGIFKSLGPAGYLEEALTERVALILWRLGRVARYETGVVESRIVAAKADVASRHDFDSIPYEEGDGLDTFDNFDRAIHTLEKLAEKPTGRLPNQQDGFLAVRAVFRTLPEDLEEVTVDEIPVDEKQYNAFNNWTWELLWKCLGAFAAAMKIDADTLRRMSIFNEKVLRQQYKDAEHERKNRERSLALEVAEKIQERMLLGPNELPKFARYESALERSLLRNLHELQRLQAARTRGLTLSPPTLDVTVSLAQEKQHIENKGVASGTDPTQG